MKHNISHNNVRNIPPPQLVPIHFEFNDPKATTVCLAGTFNNWKPEPKTLRSSGVGNWWMSKHKSSQNQKSTEAPGSSTTEASNRNEINFVPSADEVARKAYFCYVNEGSRPRARFAA